MNIIKFTIILHMEFSNQDVGSKDYKRYTWKYIFFTAWKFCFGMFPVSMNLDEYES